MYLKNQDFLDYLDELFPDAHCELNYNDLFTLLIAVMLSAQTTDASVNKVTPILFNKYPDAISLSKASLSDIENILRPLGLYKNKAKNIIECSKSLLKDFNNKIPSSLDELVKLPGVGRKTASVVLIEGFKIPAFPVDTHIKRISIRLGFANIEDNATEVDKKLRKKFDQNLWGKLHHQMIFFGRYKCKATAPLCNDCKFKNYCSKYNSSTTCK